MTPACPSSGCLCLLHSVPRSPGLGKERLPQPLSEAGDGLGMSPAAFRGFGGQSWVLQREMRKPPVGNLQREHVGTAAPGFLHTVAPQCPQPPCTCKSCWRSQLSNLRGSVDRTCVLGRHAQGILHSSAQIVMTLLSPLLWSHSAGDPRVFAHVSEAPTSELGHDGDTGACIPYLFTPGPTFTLALPGLLHHY